MSSSTTNDLTKWSDEQLCENEDDNDELFKKKSAERRCRTKAWKEAERRMAEEVVRRKAEEEVKWKAEVEAQRRAEAEAKVRAEEVAWAQVSSVVVNVPLTDLLGVETELGLGPVEGETAKGDGEWDRGGRGVGRGLSPVLRVLGRQGGMRDEGGWEQQGEVVQPLSPTAEQVRAAGGCAAILAEEAGGGDVAVGREEEGADEEQEARGCREPCADGEGAGDPRGDPGLEENFEEEEVVEAAEEKEALKGWNEEEEEVDESV
ncbi:hypothetical protein PAXRUDRAFT_17333 [Paxillus rubicundulus Ve08.2h10]|uniref:Uncharacterized protein n=1 Tax=Paxillus rubicundulus Ve08.2h10 TaxID=930991 RepID=A0A0D0D2B3_9AGAM|nr:hypothetical protein PAXRUDRAFT_17333 [Paxillus rubicundulus Ve08.2h10]